MSENTPQNQVETTSVFRADLLKDCLLYTSDAADE